MEKIKIPIVCKAGSHEDPCDFVRHGTRNRKPRIPGGKRDPLTPVARYRCKKHGHCCTLPPQSLLPRIHYTSEVVHQCVHNRVVKGLKRLSFAFLPHKKTIRRWADRLPYLPETTRRKAIRLLGETWKFMMDNTVYAITRYRLTRLWDLLNRLARKAAENRPSYFYVTARSP